MQSTGFKHTHPSRPRLGPFHETLIARAELDHALALNTLPSDSPLRKYHCWAANCATDAQLAAIAFRLWDHFMRIGGLDHFFQNTQGFGSYYVAAMITVVAKHPDDEFACSLFPALREASLSASCGRLKGRRTPEYDPENVRDIPSVRQRYDRLDNDELIRRFDRWLAVES